MKKTRKTSIGRKPHKPNYNANTILQEQMDAAVHLYIYNYNMSLKAIADELFLNPIKVRKLLITAGVYESNTADIVLHTFNTYRKTQNEKGLYFPAEENLNEINVGAERQRRYRAVAHLKKNPCEETLWNCMVAFRGYLHRSIS